MSLYAQFKTNRVKETEGIEVSYSPNSDGTLPTFIISRMGKSNKRYNKVLEAAIRPVARQIQLGTLSEAESDAIFLSVFVKAIVRGWRNIKNEAGENVEYSTEAAIELLGSLPDLYEDLQEKAKYAALFRDEVNEVDAGN